MFSKILTLLSIVTCNIRITTLAMITMLPSYSFGSVTWVPSKQGDPLPGNAILGGIEHCGSNDNVRLYVCRAKFAGGVHPGKLIGGNCNISYGGQEQVISNYDVAVGTGNWGPPGGNGALIGGQEPGRTLYVCRAHYKGDQCPWCCTDHGDHPGKVVAGKCNFGFGGQEIDSISDYDVFYPN